jgi:hypothetical protein
MLLRESFIPPKSDPQDRNGSGTHCSGLIAAKQNGSGIVGVAPDAPLVSVKVLSLFGNRHPGLAVYWSEKYDVRTFRLFDHAR